MNSLSHAADPSVTVNIYASGLLDDLLEHAIAPFWSQAQRSSPAGSCYLWIMRYARGGEHLKVRVHGPQDSANALKPLLFEHAERWIEKARSLPPAEPRRENPKAPPIDAEDKSDTPFADRTIISTTYGRTYVSFPASPWLEDDELVRLAGRCLAGTTGIFLETLAEQGALSDSQRQSLLAKALVQALRTVGWGDVFHAIDYLAFHRDWLLRFFIPESAKELEVRARFDAQANQGPVQDSLAQFIHQEWGRDSRSDEAAQWLQAYAALAAHTEKFAADSDHQIDPFTTNVTFPPVFKMLHGMANQFGVTPLHEAYVHHLLIATLTNRHSLVARELATA